MCIRTHVCELLDNTMKRCPACLPCVIYAKCKAWSGRGAFIIIIIIIYYFIFLYITIILLRNIEVNIIALFE